jgi:hypothetical protein
MKKFKFFADVVKEEKWLNTMLAKGFKCTNTSSIGVYKFKPSKESYVIRLDFQDSMSREKYEEYLGTYEDFGWTHIEGSRWGGVHYWQKVADGNDEIFSDSSSHIAYFKRLMNHSAIIGILCLIFSININEGDGFSRLFNIKASYLTAKLWDMSGSSFWSAFLFETPFALFRFLAPWCFIITAIMFLYSYMQYEKRRKQYS